MDPCLFCLRDDRPMTREHIFARWLIQQVHGGKLLPTIVVEGQTPARIARLVAQVCADCNAGWMSGLEVSFSRLMFARRAGSIQPADRATLSRWFTKTAALLAHAHGEHLFDDARTSQLRIGMPDDVEVFLGRRRRPPQRLDFSIERKPESDVRSVGVIVDEIVAHVAKRGRLTSAAGTRLWPLRTYALRWETLPVLTSWAIHGAGERSGSQVRKLT